jgi:hypothetical protein
MKPHMMPASFSTPPPSPNKVERRITTALSRKTPLNTNTSAVRAQEMMQTQDAAVVGKSAKYLETISKRVSQQLQHRTKDAVLGHWRTETLDRLASALLCKRATNRFRRLRCAHVLGQWSFFLATNVNFRRQVVRLRSKTNRRLTLSVLREWCCVVGSSSDTWLGAPCDNVLRDGDDVQRQKQRVAPQGDDGRMGLRVARLDLSKVLNRENVCVQLETEKLKEEKTELKEEEAAAAGEEEQSAAELRKLSRQIEVKIRENASPDNLASFRARWSRSPISFHRERADNTNEPLREDIDPACPSRHQPLIKPDPVLERLVQTSQGLGCVCVARSLGSYVHRVLVCNF